jgi:hypothetical protein
MAIHIADPRLARCFADPRKIVVTGLNAGIIRVPAQWHSALQFSSDGATLFANGKGGAILAFDATSLNQ